MTHDRELGRLLDRWFEDGPVQAADRVIDNVADRIGRQPQVPAWRATRRFDPTMNSIKLAGIAASIVVAAGLATSVFGPQTGPGGRTPSPSLTASPPPSDSPSPAIKCEDNLPGCAGPLTAGTHQSNQFEPGFSYTTVGAAGAWLNVIDIPAIYKIDQGDPGDPYVLLWGDAAIAAQDAACNATADPARGRKAADWIAMFTSHPGLVASAPVSVDVGGRDMAKQVELALDPSWTATCPQHAGPHVSFLT